MSNRPTHLETEYKTELSPRQCEVLALVARGKTYGEIADALGITLDGVKWHMREVLTKLGLNSREEAAEWWRRERSIARRLARAARALAPFAGVRVMLAGAAMMAVAGVAIAGTMLTWWSLPGQAQQAAPALDGGAPPPCLDGPTKFEFGAAGTDINNGESVTLGLSGGSERRELQTTATTSTPMFEWTNWCGDHSQAATIHIAAETYPAMDGKVTTPKCLDPSQPSRLVVVNRTVHNIPLDTTVIEVDPTASHAR